MVLPPAKSVTGPTTGSQFGHAMEWESRKNDRGDLPD